ncbi:tetratricopeptide repeat protein [Candidatus Nesciobacter abundans]|uniref:Tetratricopeptide repeat protein n=1 Tax=Candidatus Nesciobacter abundans TaxID=2601668 RepID=A0A5C0UH37_9PROT|nr:hypothetical protein [Candidatus Nesciobacter abundans]QEK39040.1 hypothetical protein FZC36_01145 [Candidatus Nesciobacter abundans]
MTFMAFIFFFVSNLVFCEYKTSIQDNLDNILSELQTLSDNKIISKEEFISLRNSMLNVKRKVNFLMINSKVKTLKYDSFIETITGFLPTPSASHNMEEYEYKMYLKEAIKAMSKRDFESAKRKFDYLRVNQTYDLAICYYWIGFINFNQNNLDDAIMNFGIFCKIMDQNNKSEFYLKNKSKIYRALMSMMKIYYKKNEFVKAKSLLKKIKHDHLDEIKSVSDKAIVNSVSLA